MQPQRWPTLAGVYRRGNTLTPCLYMPIVRESILQNSLELINSP